MKAPPFDYVRVAALPEVFALLQQHGDQARVLAGGQTLLATLNMRLSEPALLIDIGGLAALRGIALAGGMLRIGALTTHAEIESSALVAVHAPLLAQAAPHIAHRAIRNRGTLGGSLAYADPAAEWPACALALDATLVLASAGGERRVAANDFFTGLFETALAPGELIAAVELPTLKRTSTTCSTNSRGAAATTRSPASPHAASCATAGCRACASRSSASTIGRCAPCAPRPRSKARRSTTRRSRSRCKPWPPTSSPSATSPATLRPSGIWPAC